MGDVDPTTVTTHIRAYWAKQKKVSKKLATKVEELGLPEQAKYEYIIASASQTVSQLRSRSETYKDEVDADGADRDALRAEFFPAEASEPKMKRPRKAKAKASVDEPGLEPGSASEQPL